MADRPRSAIIGAGFIGQVHARAVHAAGGSLVAVVQVDVPTQLSDRAKTILAELDKELKHGADAPEAKARAAGAK